MITLREGAETTIFLSAVSLQTTELMNFIGAVLGGDGALAPLSAVQQFTGLKGNVRRVEVNALTKPEDAFGRSRRLLISLMGLILVIIALCVVATMTAWSTGKISR